jgi:hypothetical protein
MAENQDVGGRANGGGEDEQRAPHQRPHRKACWVPAGGPDGVLHGPDGVPNGARRGLDGVPDGARRSARREPCHQPRHF